MSVVRRKLAMWKAQVWLIRCAQSCNEFLFWVGECVNEGRERKICKWLLLWTRDGGWENQQTLNLALRVWTFALVKWGVLIPLSALFWRNQNGNSSSPVCVCQTTNKGKRDRVWDAGLYIWLVRPELLSSNSNSLVSKMPKVLHRSLSPKNGERLVCCKQGDLIIYQLEVAPVYFRPTNHNWGLYHNHTVWCRGIMHIYDVIWCGVPADPCQCGLVTLCWYEKPWNIKMHVMINRKPATDWLNMFGWFNAQQMMLNNNYALIFAPFLGIQGPRLQWHQ